MLNYIQQTCDFSDYQMAQLRYFFKTIFSEISKFLIIGIFFVDMIPTYLLGMIVLLSLRTTTGGLHLKTYKSCLLASCCYLILGIRILPQIIVGKTQQLFGLVLCCLITCYMTPITSPIHRELTHQYRRRLKIQAFILLLIYMFLLYILPNTHHTSVCFWVIILNTLQLIAAKIYYKETKKHEKTHENH